MPQLLLAVDTSGKNGSLALARMEAGESEIGVLEVVSLDGGAFSAQLVPQIAALLAKHGHDKSDLAAFAVATGPGSFTGLRVGLAAFKALAEALQKPIAAVSLLEAVACSGEHSGHVLALLDAGRGDAYVGDYEIDANTEIAAKAPTRGRMFRERLMSREELLAEAASPTANVKANVKSIVTPDKILAEVIRNSGIKVQQIDYPNASVIARIGWDHLRNNETVQPDQLEANYIRRSDAEIFSKPVL